MTTRTYRPTLIRRLGMELLLSITMGVGIGVGFIGFIAVLSLIA